MLIAALAVGALLAGGSSLLAQDATNTPPPMEHGPGGPGMKARGDIAKQLDLTPEQKPKVEAIMKSTMEKRKELREDTSLTQEEKRDKGKALQEDTSKQLKAVLTPEQFTKWQEISKRARTRPPGAPIPPKTPEATSPN